MCFVRWDECPTEACPTKQENGSTKNTTSIVKKSLSRWKFALRTANSKVGQNYLSMARLTFFVSIVRERLKRQELRKRKMAGRPLKRQKGGEEG